jgi:hypothetical protein
MLKVLAPMLLKLSVMEFFMASMEVKIPTKAVMPTAIIITVRMVRSN